MNHNAYYFEDNDLIIHVKVSTRAAKNELQAIDEHFIRIRINTPPVDGKANQFLFKFLGKTFGVAPTRITLEAGETSREKRFRIPSPTKLPAGIIKND